MNSTEKKDEPADHKVKYRPVGPRHKDGRCLTWQRALLCIDLQNLGCREGFGVFESHRQAGVPDEDIRAYLDQLQQTVLPNVRRLQNYFRSNHLEVLHTRIQSLTSDGRERSLEHKRLGLHAPPGSELAQFLPEVAPHEDEIILSKTASGVFLATNLEFILRNLCVSELYVVGVYSNECVSSAVRSAGDLGFHVTVVSDATAAISRELHKATLLTVKDRYAKVRTTEETIQCLEQSEDIGGL